MNRYLTHLSCALFGALLFGGTAFATVVDSTPRKLVQPDGASFTVIKHGDEYLSWVARPDGRPIARGDDGTWYYVRKYVDGKALLSKRPAHRSPPKGNARRPRHTPAQLEALAAVAGGGNGDSFDGSELIRGAHDGNVLIIAVDFIDRMATYDAPLWAGRISGLPGDERSIIDYFDAASYGKASLAPAAETHGVNNDGVIGPLSLPLMHPDTGQGGANGATGTTEDDVFRAAIQAADDFIDFAAYDVTGAGNRPDGALHSSELSIVIVLAGYENAYSSNTPSIHGHARTAGSIVTV